MQTLTADEIIARWESLSDEEKKSSVEVSDLLDYLAISDFFRLIIRFESRLNEAKLLVKQYETMVRQLWIHRHIANSRRIEELKAQLDEETRKREEELTSVHTFVAELTDSQPNKRIKKDDDPDQTLCCVCLANKRCIAFFPCGHICCCAECNTLTKCPLCQAEIVNSNVIYLPY